ncbi:MAG: ATP-binding protein [Rhizobacter sp.]|nr:ATP-binding protein [Rhizobacter sp.]
MHINPDHFLQTKAGRVLGEERNVAAWAQCHTALAAALEGSGGDATLFVLVGAQGSGKSTWARAKVAEDSTAIIFDAILVKRIERAPLLAAAAMWGVPAVAVWFRAPLETCLARNAARPADECADESGLRNVFAALEPPSVEEGFARILEI